MVEETLGMVRDLCSTTPGKKEDLLEGWLLVGQRIDESVEPLPDHLQRLERLL
jgi:hypothetical protein